MTDLLLLRTTIRPNDNGDGIFGLSYMWTATTGPYTTRTKNNGADAERGRFFNEGETTCQVFVVRPHSGLVSVSRAINWHDEPVSGYVWGDVSPQAIDIYKAGTVRPEPNESDRELTLEYTGGCPDATGFTHFPLPILDDELNYIFVQTTWATTCDGAVRISVINSANLESDPPQIDLVDIVTLHPAPYFPGVWQWVGAYRSSGYFTGGPTYIDHAVDLAGYSWDEALNDVPEIVDQWGSPLATVEEIGTLLLEDFPVPDWIRAIIGTDPIGGGGSAGSGFEPGGGGGSGGGGDGPAPSVPTPNDRFFNSPRWRWLVLDKDSLGTITTLDSCAATAAVVINGNAPCSADLDVPSDYPLVNIPYPTVDDEAYVAEGIRFLVGLRRLATQPTWNAEFCGKMLQINDASAGDPARSTMTAFDPWMDMYSRPVRNADGELPGPAGLSYTLTRGDVILQQLLANTYEYDGPHFIFVAGAAVNPTPEISIVFQPGTSVGEAMDQLVGTRTIDIILRPIWQPLGYFDSSDNPTIVELETYELAGGDMYNAVMGWDTAGNSLVGIERGQDGTQRQNEIVFYDTTGVPAAVAADSASVAKYGEYWAQQYFPGQIAPGAVAAFAANRLLLRKNGLRSINVSPSTSRGPVWARDYRVFDRVPVYASARFREPLATLQRVLTVPISVSNAGIEQIRGIIFTEDGWQDIDPGSP